MHENHTKFMSFGGRVGGDDSYCYDSGDGDGVCLYTWFLLILNKKKRHKKTWRCQTGESPQHASMPTLKEIQNKKASSSDCEAFNLGSQ